MDYSLWEKNKYTYTYYETKMSHTTLSLSHALQEHCDVASERAIFLDGYVCFY